MPDYIYLLENRLSADQQHALRQLREASREAGMILFLTGDAVRDLTSGHGVRELEVAVHGNALKLKKPLEKLGGKVWGEDEATRTLYLCFPGTVRVDVVSTHRVEYPKPGRAVVTPASIHEDLRRLDFTANAMAISLNEGSFGLLMDPLNGAADIEARALRLVSNYGFLEEPSLMIRATRYRARLGWDLDPKTATRYQNAKDEGVIEHLSSVARSRELEQIGHEEEGLKVLAALEAEGWMKVLYPAWTSAKADAERLEQLHEQAVQLMVQGVHPDMSAAQMELLTAKLAAKDLAGLKKLLLRPGFAEEWESLDAQASGFQKALLAKENQTASSCFKLFHSYDPEAILWLGFTTKSAAVKDRYQLLLKTWPEMRQQIPFSLMLEMRITPELPIYQEVVEKVFLELIDGRLTTAEEQKAFLEPYSPPAPPVQEYKRSRGKRRAEPKVKDTSFDEEEENEDGLDDEEELDDMGGDDEDVDLGIDLPKVELDTDSDPDAEMIGSTEEDGEEDGEDDEEPEKVAPKPVKAAKRGPKEKEQAEKPAPVAKVEKAAPAAKAEKAPAKPAAEPVAKAPEKSRLEAKAKPSAKPEEKSKPAAKAPAAKAVPAAKPVPAMKKAVAKVVAKPVAKAAPKPAAKPAAKTQAKPAAKAPAKPAPKSAAKPAAKPAPKPPAKAVAKKPAAKPAKAVKPAAKKPAAKHAKKR